MEARPRDGRKALMNWPMLWHLVLVLAVAGLYLGQAGIARRLDRILDILYPNDRDK